MSDVVVIINLKVKGIGVSNTGFLEIISILGVPKVQNNQFPISQEKPLSQNCRSLTPVKGREYGLLIPRRRLH